MTRISTKINNYKDRKKRRGVIEKKRRDRINNCLSELKRLVPQAIQKELSEKLEKAEILQLTAEYLKIMKNEGQNTKTKMDNSFIDYKSMGFRDCVSEISRYLVESEGLNLQNPFRLRLLSHLQCFTDNNDTTSSQQQQQQLAKTSNQDLWYLMSVPSLFYTSNLFKMTKINPTTTTTTNPTKSNKNISTTKLSSKSLK